MRRHLLLLFLILIFFPQNPYVEAFSRTLFLGATGEDVRELQVILNKDSRTMISVTGPGSPGQETSYFGLKTRDAVMRFQDIYKNEVLVPAGVVSPTGIVGQKTQAKLLSMGNPSNLEQIVPKDVSIQVPTESRPETITDFLASFFRLPPKLFAVSPMTAKPGGEILIRGQGFSEKDNTVHFGNQFSVEGIPSLDGMTLTVNIPSSLSEGSYNIWVTHKGGSTYSASYGDFFIVSKNPSTLPEILPLEEEILIQYGASSAGVSLKTRGMNTGSIKILTSLGEIQGTIDGSGVARFSLSDAPEWKNFTVPFGQDTNRRLPVYVYLRNSAGFSDPVVVWVYFPKS